MLMLLSSNNSRNLKPFSSCFNSPKNALTSAKLMELDNDAKRGKKPESLEKRTKEREKGMGML